LPAAHSKIKEIHIEMHFLEHVTIRAKIAIQNKVGDMDSKKSENNETITQIMVSWLAIRYFCFMLGNP